MEQLSENMNLKTAILGFGNPVRADDGIGIYVIDKLKEHLSSHDHISLFDMGTSAFEILYKLKDHGRIILIDAVINSAEPPGTVFKLPASAIEAEIQDDPLVFLHSLKWDQALSYAKKIFGEDYPAQVEVYLIAIESTRFNVGLSETVIQGGDQVVEKLLSEFKVSV